MLDHGGSLAGSKCKLDHHPFPCDFSDHDDNVCKFHVAEGDDTEDQTGALALTR